MAASTASALRPAGRLLIDTETVEFAPDSTIVLPAVRDHRIINDGEPLQLIAAFSASPVGTFSPAGATIELRWRS